MGMYNGHQWVVVIHEIIHTTVTPAKAGVWHAAARRHL
jgi:hypothetical protein